MEKIKQHRADEEGLLNKDLSNIGKPEIKQTENNGMSRRDFMKKTLWGLGALALGAYGIKEMKPNNEERFRDILEMLDKIEDELEDRIAVYSSKTQSDTTLEAVAQEKLAKCQEAKVDISLIRNKILNLKKNVSEEDVQDIGGDWTRLYQALKEIGVNLNKTLDDNMSIPDLVKKNFTQNI